jgi:hypothetical protein
LGGQEAPAGRQTIFGDAVHAVRLPVQAECDPAVARWRARADDEGGDPAWLEWWQSVRFYEIVQSDNLKKPPDHGRSLSERRIR